ncbi:MAG: hypothetical protein ED559_11050 [Phycisphaera sp.]|nr:MAG: hypothetical protein ED559_11050 [Phycisphaera sp.]
MSEQAEQKKGEHPRVFWPFPGLVFVLIGLSLTMGAITVTVATNDPSFGLEEDYFAKAVAWDETAAQMQANKNLGWTADVDLSKSVDGKGERSVMVLISDPEGNAVEGASVEAFVYHNARRSDTYSFDLVEIAPGRYSAGQPLSRDGKWTVRLRVTSGDNVFTASVDEWTN